MKCCTKLETAKKRCPIVFQGHPSNFKVTQDKTSPILTQIGRFWTIGRSQLSNPSDLPCFSLDIEVDTMEILNDRIVCLISVLLQILKWVRKSKFHNLWRDTYCQETKNKMLSSVSFVTRIFKFGYWSWHKMEIFHDKIVCLISVCQCQHSMMTWYGNAFRIIGPLWEETTSQVWIL